MKITIVTAIAAVLIAVGLAAAPTASADELTETVDTFVVCVDPVNGTADVDCDGVGDEDEGRQQDCPDGQVGTVHSHVLICPAPIVADPEPPVVEEPVVEPPVVEEPVVEPPVVEEAASAPVIEQPVVTPEPVVTVTPVPAASTAELAYTGIRDYTPALAAGGFLLIALGAVFLRISRRRAH